LATNLSSRTVRVSDFNDGIKAAFAFLESCGYRLVAESGSGPFGGAITYRSADLWIVVEWDRGDVHLEFAPTQSWQGRVPRDNIDHLLRGADRFDREPPLLRRAPIGELADFTRDNLVEIERRFTPAARPSTEAFLRTLEADRRQRAKDYRHR
jgi:hypothetical protein